MLYHLALHSFSLNDIPSHRSKATFEFTTQPRRPTFISSNLGVGL